MPTCKKLVLFGLGDLAEIAHLYFERDTDYQVVGYTVDCEFMTRTEWHGLPVVPFDEVENIFPPDTHEFHACIVYGKMNRCRESVCKRAKEKGYKLASYISPHAYIDSTAEIGEHAFIFENNTVQPFTKIGDNTILWSGNHIGHSSIMGDNVFVSSHVVISGHCRIGSNCFIGVNTTIPNGIAIGNECWVMPGSIISKDIPDHSLVRNVRGDYLPLNEDQLERALERAKK